MNKKGFTLMELTIVLALLVIVAAILVPTFILTTERARLRADIQSAQVIQNAIELYRIERGEVVVGLNDDNMDTVINRLVYVGYINPRNIAPQTEDAEWHFEPNFGVMVDIRESGNEVRRAYIALNDAEREFVFGGSSSDNDD